MRRGERRRRVTPCLEENELAFTYLLALLTCFAVACNCLFVSIDIPCTLLLLLLLLLMLLLEREDENVYYYCAATTQNLRSVFTHVIRDICMCLRTY
jgi:hypothetical protein